MTVSWILYIYPVINNKLQKKIFHGKAKAIIILVAAFIQYR